MRYGQRRHVLAPCRQRSRAGTTHDSIHVHVAQSIWLFLQGHLTWSAVDRSLKRLMKLRFLLGLFDPIEDQPLWKVPLTIVQNDEAVALNRLATQQSMVLLKNERDTLPFRKGLHVAVVSTFVSNIYCMCVILYVSSYCSRSLYLLPSSYPRTSHTLALSLSDFKVGPHGNGSSVLIGNYRGQVCPTNYDDLSCVQSVFQASAK